MEITNKDEKVFVDKDEFVQDFMQAGNFTREFVKDFIQYIEEHIGNLFIYTYINRVLGEVNSNDVGNPDIKIIFDQNTNEFLTLNITNRSYNIDDVSFESLEEYIAIKKNDAYFTFEVLKYTIPTDFVTPSGFECNHPSLPHPDEYETLFNSIEPMTYEQALKSYKDNEERKNVAINIITNNNN